MKPNFGIDAAALDLLGMFRRHFLNLNAALGRGNERELAPRTIHEQRKVEFAADVATGLDIHLTYDLSCRTGLWREEGLANQLLRNRTRIAARFGQLHTARLAAATGMNLRLYDTDLPVGSHTKSIGSGFNLAGRMTDEPPKHREPEGSQHRFRLVLV